MYGTPDSDFSVFSAKLVDFEDRSKVKVDKGYGTFKIAGHFALDDNEIGSVLTVTIEEDYASRYPNSYKLIKLHYELPSEAKAQWAYLKNSNIVPLGTYLAIESKFRKSDKILDIMINNPKKMTEVRGIGEKRALKYQTRLKENKDKAAIFAEYGDIEGVGSKTITSLVNWKLSVVEAIEAIEKDPFSLLEIEGIGFMLADKFRAHYGLPLNDKNRMLHGTSYFLEKKFHDKGDTYDNVFEAAKFTADKLFVSYEELVTFLSEIQSNDKELEKYGLKIFGKNISTKVLFDAELLIYGKVRGLKADNEKIKNPREWSKIKAEVLSSITQTLSDGQDQFLDLINDSRIVALLGPGGSGKSWAISLACQMITSAGKTYGLFAPTARAAHVMGEYVDKEAYTIHRGLLPRVLMNETATEDVLIVDEYSMVDSELASVVLKAMGEHTRLIIVGDDFQLQSVGPGNVLFDLVEYLDIPTVKLTEIFRQGADSWILNYASDLRSGNFNIPSQPKVDKGDIVFINESNNQSQQDLALSLYNKAYKKYGVDGVMLLTPVNKGPSGRGMLNKKIQSIVNNNPDPLEVSFGLNQPDLDKVTIYRPGDFISIKSNNYNMVTDDGEAAEIINGDLGVIRYTFGNKLTIETNGNYYTIDKSEVMDLIDHAWSTTIHKSQGGQASEVVIVLPKNCYFMLNANMLYTAITRAKVKCWIIGDFEGINSSAKEQANLTRKTMIQLKQLSEDRVRQKQLELGKARAK